MLKKFLSLFFFSNNCTCKLRESYAQKLFLVHVAYFCKFMYTMKMLKEMETLSMFINR